MILKLGMQHWGLKLYKVCINGDPWLTLTNFTEKSNYVTSKGFSIRKSEKSGIFQKHLKVGRCRQLIELMKLYEYMY